MKTNEIAVGRREGNHVPVIERMLDILEIIERRPDGANIRELSDFLETPRSTVYRILNTLEAREIVRRGLSGAYVLGPRLLSLAANVSIGSSSDLAGIATPHLERLSFSTGEASKLSIRDGDGVLVVATVQGSGEYGLNIKPGRRLPLHAGAASRVLLAHLSQEEVNRVLKSALERFTDHTISDPRKLAKELKQVRVQGWAFDNGEYSPGVVAVAAPVQNKRGDTVAAVSIPFLSTGDDTRIAKLRTAVCNTAKAISKELAAHNL
ncbi:IclR family transcriptional regulator [Microvirga yunnanensis]|uniref:IclR family transcriptional regulator n=1 Tax=Microvirga yunnanensis TaxID=2953740 RepID=UPI0021CA36C5|nr:IclR family transcriptional regulator [Microvirga sp. HBU65207]